MIPDDTSALSAFADDELGPDDRAAVEARLAAEPALRAALADLESVRRSVADLARPAAPCRLASAVLARVEAAESARGRRPVYWVATAASLAFGCLLMLRSGLIAGPKPPADVPGGAAAHPTVVVRDDGGAIPPEPAPRATPAPVEVVTPRLGPAPEPDAAARRRMVALLERPGAGRMVVLPRVSGGDAAARVDAMLRGTGRKNPEFGRVAVAPGLGIDPRHPEGGEAFVALMDEQERREFRSLLRRSFAEVVDEPAVEPGLPLALADLPGVTLGSGEPAAGLKPPPPAAKVASQHRDVDDVARTEVRPANGGPVFRGDPMREAQVVHEVPEPDDAAEDAVARPSRPAPVIIWVAGGTAPKPVE